MPPCMGHGPGSGLAGEHRRLTQCSMHHWCSGRVMDNAVASFIHGLGNTKVLSREVEQQLALIVHKGARLERAVRARGAELGRPLTAAEVVQLQARGPPRVLRCCRPYLARRPQACRGTPAFHRISHGHA